MYTQCDHCKAIFEVSMREVTVASGKLRCGECNTVFDAMASLSTTQPKPFSALQEANVDMQSPTSVSTTARQSELVSAQAGGRAGSSSNQHKESQSHHHQQSEQSVKSTVWQRFILVALIALLLAQIAYNHRDELTGAPRHQPELIEMLNNNVFAHPNEPGVLMIAASIENRAGEAQPFPVLEVSLKDSESNLIALRRFKPAEYLPDYQPDMLMPVGQPVNLNLKIVDPGDKATRFQFRFL